MFGLFKKKLKEVVSKFSRKTEEEPKEKAVEEEKEIKELKEEKPKKRFSLFKKKHKEELTEEKIEEKKEEIKKEIKEKKSEEIKEEKPKVKISEEKFEKLFEDLEMVLLENNVAYGVIDKIKEDLKVDLVNVPLSNVKKTIETSLKNSIEGVLSFGNIDLIKRIKEKKPYVILFLGVNGAGKTTTIAKLANLFLKNGLRCVFVASDTFRAASIQQLEEHGKILGIN